MLSSLTVFLQWLIPKAEVNRAVLYGVLTNVWSTASGPVTLLLMASYFSAEIQGYYYTFGSVLALQVLVQLGLGTVITQFAAHEWARLGFGKHGEIVGDSAALSRLVSLGQLALGWFAIGGVLVAVGLGVGGYIFFSKSTYPGIDWVGPWFLLCVLSGMRVWLLPIWSLLEGCNQVSQVYAYRMIEGILRSPVIWCAILLGAELWTPAISTAVLLVWGAVFLGRQYLPFLRTFFCSIEEPRLSWRFEIWPMQWRIALSWLSGYFIFSLFTPILFHYHGPVVAGQMGMTWTLIATVAITATAWVKPRAPKFGILIAKEEYAALDRLFFRVASVSIGVLLVGASAVWGGIYLLNAIDYPLAERLLPPLPAGLFLLAHVLMQITYPLSVYLRAHKQEPYVGVSVITAVLTALSTWCLGSRFGAVAMGTGYLAIVAFVTLPYAVIVWFRCRSVWHSHDSVTSEV